MQDQSKYKISRMGNQMHCIGATFTVVPKYSHRFLHGQVIEIGKVASVVKQKGSSVPWFKFYDFEKYPMDPPERGTSEYMYVECATILSTDSKKTAGIKWTRRNSVSKQSAKRTKTFFEMEYGPSRRFDDQLDSLPKNKRATKKATATKDYCSKNDGSSSDSISSTETASNSEEEQVCELKDDSEDDLDDNYSDDNVLAQQME